MAKADKSLAESIKRKITDTSSFIESLPGVVIVHDLRTSAVVYMNRSGLKRLNISMEELIEIGADYHSRFFNEVDVADYAPKVMGMLARNNDEESVSFFQQVRAHANDPWEWHACCTRVFMRDTEGAPLLIISVAMPIDPKHYFLTRLERMIEEKEYSVKNAHLFAALGPREKQILSLMAKDLTSRQVADLLSIAEDTVKTHRRNIKRKLSVKTQYDLVRFAQTFDLI